MLRLLPRTQELLSIEKIGLAHATRRRCAKLIRRNERHHPGHRADRLAARRPRSTPRSRTSTSPTQNIMTIEDPVEIQLPGISQIEVKPTIGLTFAAGLRSILRQDPNVDPGRRDPRPGDRRDRDPGRRSPATWCSRRSTPTSRAEHDHAPDRHGRRAVPDRVVAGRGDRAAADPRAVQRCREAYTPSDEELAEIGLRRADVASAHDLPREGLRALQPHRLSRPHGHLRDPDASTTRSAG